MRIVYHGPHPEAEVEYEDGTVIEGIIPGEPVDIRDEIAESLLKQEIWSRVISQVPVPPVGKTNGSTAATPVADQPHPAVNTPAAPGTTQAPNPDTKE